MIPIRDVIPSPGMPAVTLALIAVQAAAWCVQTLISPDGAPAFHPQAPGLPTIGSAVRAVFDHNSALHLAGNTWSLWIFGDKVEGRLGRGPFLALYLCCGTATAFGEMLLVPSAMLLSGLSGSSGATAGVMGAYLALFPQSRVLTFVPRITTWDLVEVPAGWLLGAWWTLQLIIAGALSGPVAASGPSLLAITTSLLAGGAAGQVVRRRRSFPAW